MTALGKLRDNLFGNLRAIWAVFARDVKRLVRNPVATVVVLGVCLLPSLYAWYCVAANWDPYGSTESIKVAVANDDKGAATERTGPFDVGDQVVAKLRDNHDLGWEFVDRDQAVEGVHSGEYYAAIVIPEDFSEHFASVLTGDFSQPELDYYVNEKLSSVAPKITDAGATSVEEAVDHRFAEAVGATVIELTQKVGHAAVDEGDAAEGSLTRTVAAADGAIERTRSALDGLEPALRGAQGAVGGAQGSLEALRGQLPAVVADLAQARAQLSAIRDLIESCGQTAEEEVPELPEALALASRALDGFGSAIGALEGVARGSEPVTQETQAIVAMLQEALGQAQGSLGLAAQALDSVQGSLGASLEDLRTLQASASTSGLLDYLALNPQEAAQFLAQPVALRTVPVFPVANYGSGVTPFYTNLALWVSGFILMAIVRLRVDPTGLPPLTPLQAYFGRWLFYVAVGLAQGLVVCVGDLALGIQCVSPVAFVGAGLLAVFVYVNLMYALAFAFRHIGKALAVLLLIMQIPGSSGMYPVEMMPAFFQAINPLLPFTYSIDAMREAIGGFYGLHYLGDMLALGVPFTALGLLIGLVIGRYDVNLAALFDKELGETDLFASEEVPPDTPRFRKGAVVRALLDATEFRSQLLERAARFRRRYPRLVRAGWAATFALPVAMFAIIALVKADVELKLVLLAIMVAGIIAVDAYLVVIAYLDASLGRQLALASASPKQLRDEAAQAGSLRPAAQEGEGAFAGAVLATGSGACPEGAEGDERP